MLKDRIKNYNALEKLRESKLIVYITGDRQGLETKIHSEQYDLLVNHLDLIDDQTENISLFLYTRGGDTLAGWSLINLIKLYCNQLEVIIPSKAHSTGTLICLGANKIIMTKHATLGPIDPSVNTPLNPTIPSLPSNVPIQHRTVPVSVEAINGFFELAKTELQIKNDENISNILIKLCEMVHPLVLGETYRAKSQIKMLAKILLEQQHLEKPQIENIISFLVSESGSHDYTINRKEAKERLKLNIEEPDSKLDKLTKEIFSDICDELELRKRYDPNTILGQEQSKKYKFRRALIESVKGGCDVFISEGILNKVQLPPQPGIQPIGFQDNRSFEAWRHEDV